MPDVYTSAGRSWFATAADWRHRSIVCGMPGIPGVTAVAHIHMRDRHLSPRNNATRVFRPYWHHHHGCCDQDYIATVELFEG
jgi:hypothetical protein